MTEKESNNLGRQPPETRAWGWFWDCLNQLELYCGLQEKPPGPVLPKTQGRESLSRYHFGFSPVLVKTGKGSLRKMHQLYSGISENVTLTEELCLCLKQEPWLCPGFEEFPWSSLRSIFRLRSWIFYGSYQCMLPSAVSVTGSLPPGKYRGRE